MAEQNPRDLPGAATGTAGADVFSAEPMSFKMDRMSPEALALRDAVSRKLLEFLGAYSDNVLTEYITVLVCNGKHQNQARDDLEAFLGDESESFVAWLWDYLTSKTSVSKPPPIARLDEETKNSSYANNIEDSDRYNGFCPSQISSVKGHADEPQEQARTVYGNVHVANSNKSGSIMCMDGSLISSGRTVSGGEQCLQSQYQHQKIAKSNSSALPCQPLSVPKTEQVRMNSQLIVREDTKPRPVTVKSVVSSRPSANVIDVVEAQVNRPRGNVWDRLSKPCKDNETILRGEKHHAIKTETLNHHVEQDPRSIIVQPYRLSGNETENVAVFDKIHKRTVSNNRSQEGNILEYNKQGSHERVDKSKRMRPDSGNISISFSSSQEASRQDKEGFQNTKGSLPCKHQCLPRSNDLATEVKSKTGIPEPSCISTESINEHNLQSDKVVQSALENRTSLATMGKNIIPHCSSTLGKSESIKHASGNIKSGPVQNEILNVKLKLQQVEKHMNELRSKQADLNNWKPIPPSGLQNISKEDVESRTVFVTNVHFAASRELLLSHFAKCGPIVKVTILTDSTGQPKGEAFIIFSNKESIEKAMSLSGTSFFSRILMVTRKSELPSGSSIPTQSAPKLSAQPWYPQSHKNGAIRRPGTSSHLQWKRDESVTREVTRESSTPVSTNKLESANAGE